MGVMFSHYHSCAEPAPSEGGAGIQSCRGIAGIELSARVENAGSGNYLDSLPSKATIA